MSSDRTSQRSCVRVRRVASLTFCGFGRYDYATRAYVDGKYDDLLKKLKQLEKAMAKALKTELKQFERDVMVFLEDSRKEMHNISEAAVGKIHFRCLSCDQVTGSQHGEC